jgi:hypothetical protein
MLNTEIWEAQLVYASNEQLLEWAKLPEWEDVTRYARWVQDQNGEAVDGTLGDELIRRMKAGRTEEVMALLEQQQPAINARLDRITDYGRGIHDTDCPWYGDDLLWFRLASVMAPFGYLPSCSDKWPTRSPALTEQARLWFVQSMEQLANQREEEGFTESAIIDLGDMAIKSIQLMYYPGMIPDECERILEWVDNHISEAGINTRTLHWYYWKGMIQALSTEDRIRIARKQSEKLAYDIVEISSQDYRKDPGLWEPWFDYFSESPERCKDHHINNDYLIELYWPYASDEQKKVLIYFLTKVIDQKRDSADMSRVVAIFDRILEEYPDLFIAILDIDHHGNELAREKITTLVFENKHLDFMQPVLIAMTAISRNREWDTMCYPAVLKQIADEYPYLIAKLTGNQLAGLVARFDAATLNQVLPEITSVIKRSCPKSLSERILSISGQLSLSRIEECGWLTKPGKRLAPLVTEVLLARKGPEVIPLLQTFLAKGELEPGTASRVEEKLHTLGAQSLSGSTTADDAESLESLEMQAAKVKNFTKLVETVCEPALLALMSPLSPHAASVLLLLMSKDGDTPSPLALRLIEQVSINQRSAWIRALKSTWQSQQCHVKYRWLMELAHYLTPADDYAWVTELYRDARQWSLKAKDKEVDVGLYLIQMMGRLGSTYAWSCLLEIQANPGLWRRRGSFGYLSKPSELVAHLLEQEANAKV